MAKKLKKEEKYRKALADSFYEIEYDEIEIAQPSAPPPAPQPSLSSKKSTPLPSVSARIPQQSSKKSQASGPTPVIIANAVQTSSKQVIAQAVGNQSPSVSVVSTSVGLNLNKIFASKHFLVAEHNTRSDTYQFSDKNRKIEFHAKKIKNEINFFLGILDINAQKLLSFRIERAKISTYDNQNQFLGTVQPSYTCCICPRYYVYDENQSERFILRRAYCIESCCRPNVVIRREEGCCCCCLGKPLGQFDKLSRPCGCCSSSYTVRVDLVPSENNQFMDKARLLGAFFLMDHRHLSRAWCC